MYIRTSVAGMAPPEEYAWYLLMSTENPRYRLVPDAGAWYEMRIMIGHGQRLGTRKNGGYPFIWCFVSALCRRKCIQCIQGVRSPHWWLYAPPSTACWPIGRGARGCGVLVCQTYQSGFSKFQAQKLRIRSLLLCHVLLFLRRQVESEMYSYETSLVLPSRY